jgi:CRISPR-associated protein Cmr1
MSVDARDWLLTARAPLWTGDANGQNGRLISTGLLGSIRWWLEVVVRGLGGAACDPSDTSGRCDPEGRHCVACELFGCTGWARKFRFHVLDQHGKSQSARIEKDTVFMLRFVRLRPIRPEEWALIDITLRLIAEYGALGGKTVYKPSDEASRQNQAHHRDHGLVALTQAPAFVEGNALAQLEKYVSESRWRRPNHGEAAWASLNHFWCVEGRYLARQNANHSTFNRVIGRPEPKGKAGGNDSWLAGRRAGQGGDPESKKVFSFKSPARTFGFVKPGTISLDQVKRRLASAWPDFSASELLAGSGILDDLLKRKASPP